MSDRAFNVGLLASDSAFKKDFSIRKYIYFDIKFVNFIKTVKYHWVISPLSKQERFEKSVKLG